MARLSDSLPPERLEGRDRPERDAWDLEARLGVAERDLKADTTAKITGEVLMGVIAGDERRIRGYGSRLDAADFERRVGAPPAFALLPPLGVFERDGDLTIVAIALREIGVDLDQRSAATGETALIRAVRQPHTGRRRLVKALLAAGADPNARRADGATPLIVSICEGRRKCAAELLISGADPLLKDAAGRTISDHGYDDDDMEKHVDMKIIRHHEALRKAEHERNLQMNDAMRKLQQEPERQKEMIERARREAFDRPLQWLKESRRPFGPTPRMTVEQASTEEFDAMERRREQQLNRRIGGFFRLFFYGDGGQFWEFFRSDAAEDAVTCMLEFWKRTGLSPHVALCSRLAAFTDPVQLGDALRAFVNEGTDLNATTRFEAETPLSRLMLDGGEPDADLGALTAAVLEEGADPNAPNRDGETPLALARRHGRSAAIPVLEAAGGR